MRTIYTIQQKMFFNSQLNEILGITNGKTPAGTHLYEKLTKLTNIDKICLKCDCVDG